MLFTPAICKPYTYFCIWKLFSNVIWKRTVSFFLKIVSVMHFLCFLTTPVFDKWNCFRIQILRYIFFYNMYTLVIWTYGSAVHTRGLVWKWNISLHKVRHLPYILTYRWKISTYRLQKLSYRLRIVAYLLSFDP